MDIIEHQDRLVDAGFNINQAREILRLVTSGDAHSMTKADGAAMEQRLGQRVDALETKLNSRIDTLDSRIGAQTHKLTATVWTVGGVAVAILLAADYLI